MSAPEVVTIPDTDEPVVNLPKAREWFKRELAGLKRPKGEYIETPFGSFRIENLEG